MVLIFVGVQPFSTTLFGVPSLLPTPQGRRGSQLSPGRDHAQVRDSYAAQGNTQNMEATLANLLRKECQGCCEA